MVNLKTSVAMCTYNGEKFLMEQLESIANQSQLPDEIIICDDKSTDDTLNIIQEFKKKAPFDVKLYVNNEQLGSTRNFERAIKFCSGNIIFLADQDDIWEKDKLLKTFTIFKEKEMVGLVFTNARMVNENLEDLGYTLWESVGFKKKQKNSCLNKTPIDTLIKYNVVTGATCAFRSELNKFFLPISPNWVHDAWISLIVATINNVEIEFIDDQLIKYRQHANNQIGARKINIIKKLKGLLNKDVNSLIATQLVQIIDVKNHLASHETLIGNSIELLVQKEEHLKFRYNLSTRLFIRLRSIMKKENIIGYYKFSNGGRSILKDLFLKS